jgi:hypothetical protein
MADKLTRIAIVNNDKCKPKKCRQECKKSCPVVRMGTGLPRSCAHAKPPTVVSVTPPCTVEPSVLAPRALEQSGGTKGKGGRGGKVYSKEVSRALTFCHRLGSLAMTSGGSVPSPLHRQALH